MSLQSFPIVGLVKGYQTNVKPAMLPDQASQILENSYTFRERYLKREGRKLLGRLQRNLVLLSEPAANGTGTYTVTDLLSSFRVAEAKAEIEPGSVDFVFNPGGPNETHYKDTGQNGVMVYVSGPYTLNAALPNYVDYVTGHLTLHFSVDPPNLTTAAVNISYWPSLPVMGTIQREQGLVNDRQTIWFDTIYAYIWTGTNFDEFIPNTTWAGTNADFFWGFNYRGANPQDLYFFVTNFVNDVADPMRYTQGSSWTTFAPLSTASTTIFQARIIISYFGRLLLLNTWEGDTGLGPGSAVNIFNRCRFSQQGSPVDPDAFRTDIFGKGGVMDAPVSEAITGATFIKNTLVVDFEYSTWQLRYVGEYGQPFTWERVSSDYGSSSTFSGILFDNYRLSIGDKAIINANGNAVNRIDLDIPDTVFNFINANDGFERIAGVRDYQKELIYWCYPDAQTSASSTQPTVYPNKVLVYNYRNNTWAIFRDTVTSFGTFQSTTATLWGSLSVFWGDYSVLWQDFDTESLFPLIVCGDQQGFVSCYGFPSPSNISTVPANDQETLTVQDINLLMSPIQITSLDHNLQNDEIIYLSGLLFLDTTNFQPVASNLNNQIYQVQIVNKDTFYIQKWNTTIQDYQKFFPFTPLDPTTVIYVGGGRITLFPKLNIVTKDINIYQGKSLQTKLSRLDFLAEPFTGGALSVNLWLNASVDGSTPGVVQGNLLVGNQVLSIDALPPFYTPGSDYCWFRLYATLAAQYFNIQITYNDDQMNNIATHSQAATIYAIVAWCRPGGKNVF